MKPINVSRRDFLKLITATTVSSVASPLMNAIGKGDHPNVLILLFDTLSARHMSLYGYPRETTPNMAKFAEKSTVFHKHYSAANFTSPATPSMLMGMYPWKHRAFNFGGLVARHLEDQNLFNLLGNTYHRNAFAQTLYANNIVKQFQRDIDHLLPPTAFSISGDRFFLDNFLKEKGLTWYLFNGFTVELSPDLPGSLVGGYLSTLFSLRHGQYYRYGFPDYPKGLPLIPNDNIAFRLEDVFSGVLSEIKSFHQKNQPFASYYHLYAPHEPSKPRKEFIKLFKDNYLPLEKPQHPLAATHKYPSLVQKRLEYDRYIANVDYEFGLLMDELEKDGILENTYVIVTSDHGQLFERGEYGHGTPLIYDSVIHVPLMIHAPKQSIRKDVKTITSIVDVLPTLLSLLGLESSPNIDGNLLPEFGGKEDPARAIFSMNSPRNSAFLPLTQATIAMMQGVHKLIYTAGYKDYPEVFELYNLAEDPEEVNNLINKDIAVANKMKEQLLYNFNEANKPYQK